MSTKNRSLLLLVFVLINFCLKAQNLIPYHKGDNWGFCTVDKKVVVKPSYERVELFKNGYALVVKGNKLGMINEKGEELIPCLYKDLAHLKNGLIKAKNEELLYGYIDSTNKVVVPFQYDYASDFNKGIACVRLKKGDCFLIDKKGKKIGDNPDWIKTTWPEYFLPDVVETACYAAREVPPVVNGLSYLKKKNEKGDLRAFLVDDKGKQLSKRGYIDINLYLYKISNQPFIEVFDYNKGNLYGLIDRNGKEIVTMQRSRFSDFYFGLAYNQNCIIDTTGKVLLDSVAIYYASDRFVRVKYNDTTMRYYDLKRKTFFPGVFVWGSSVSNGVAFTKTDEGHEVSVNLMTGKKKELTEVQKRLEKFRDDDALNTPWGSGLLAMHSKMRFRFLNDSVCFDKYYITDNNGTPTGAVVYSYRKFMNSITDKNGNKKEELTFTKVTPDIFGYAITDSDTLIILNSFPVLRDAKNVVKTDPVNMSVLSSDQTMVIDLNGKIRYEVNMDGAKAFDKMGNLINTFPCYTCDGAVKGIINHRISYDPELKMFLSPMGYISTDFKTAYFEE